MYVVAGATGRVGSATAEHLLADDAPVRVLVRTPAAAERWAARGAEARVTGLDERRKVADAIAGVEGLFVLLPFDLGADDLDAHADRLTASIARAVADAGVPHTVMLSSGGADLDAGTGPITGLHRLEEALRASGTRLTALRSGHFQEKVGDLVGLARAQGVYPVFAASADVPQSMVATRDLGGFAAAALLSPPAASEVVDVLGPEHSEREVAGILGHAIGRELHVETQPREAWADSLVDAGFPPHVARALAELYRAGEDGLLDPRGDRAVHARTPLRATIDRLLAAPAA